MKIKHKISQKKGYTICRSLSNILISNISWGYRSVSSVILSGGVRLKGDLGWSEWKRITSLSWKWQNWSKLKNISYLNRLWRKNSTYQLAVNELIIDLMVTCKSRTNTAHFTFYRNLSYETTYSSVTVNDCSYIETKQLFCEVSVFLKLKCRLEKTHQSWSNNEALQWGHQYPVASLLF